MPSETLGAEQADEHGDRLLPERVDAGLLVGGVAGAPSHAGYGGMGGMKRRLPTIR